MFLPMQSPPASDLSQQQDTAGAVVEQGYGDPNPTGSVFDTFIDAAANVVSAVVDAILPVQSASAASEVASAEFGGGEPPASGNPTDVYFPVVTNNSPTESQVFLPMVTDNIQNEVGSGAVNENPITPNFVEVNNNLPPISQESLQAETPMDALRAMNENTPPVHGLDFGRIGDIADAVGAGAMLTTALISPVIPQAAVIGLGVSEIADWVSLAANFVNDIQYGYNDLRVSESWTIHASIGTETLFGMANIGSPFSSLGPRNVERLLNELPEAIHGYAGDVMHDVIGTKSIDAQIPFGDPFSGNEAFVIGVRTEERVYSASLRIRYCLFDCP